MEADIGMSSNQRLKDLCISSDAGVSVVNTCDFEVNNVVTLKMLDRLEQKVLHKARQRLDSSSSSWQVTLTEHYARGTLLSALGKLTTTQHSQVVFVILLPTEKGEPRTVTDGLTWESLNMALQVGTVILLPGEDTALPLAR